MVPAVLIELLSDPKLPIGVAETLSDVPLIEIESGYWQRAGELRAKVLAKRRKARLGDALIAQSCIDERVPLLTSRPGLPSIRRSGAPRSYPWILNVLTGPVQ